MPGEQYGLDREWVRGACREIFSEADRHRSLTPSTNIFRVLVKTLLSAGIITERTRHVYAAWLDIEGLDAEGEAMVGDAVAAEGIDMLREINRGRKRIGRTSASFATTAGGMPLGPAMPRVEFDTTVGYRPVPAAAVAKALLNRVPIARRCSVVFSGELQP